MAGGDANIGSHPVVESVDTTEATSENRVNSHHVEDEEEGNPHDDNYVGHQNMLMLQQMAGMIQNAIATNRIEMEQFINEKLASTSNENHTHHVGSNEENKGPVVRETPKDQAKQVSFKNFKSCGATEFTGTQDPTAACAWLDKTKRVFEISHCLEADKVMYATALLSDRALDWWNATSESMGDERRRSLTWKEFTEKFLLQFCPPDMQRKYEREFLELKQGTMTVTAYEAEFHKKSKFATQFIPKEEMRVRRFVEGLRWEIREFVEVRDIPTLEKAAEYARCREEAITVRNSELMPPPKKANTNLHSNSFRGSSGKNFSRAPFQNRSQSVRNSVNSIEV